MFEAVTGNHIFFSAIILAFIGVVLVLLLRGLNVRESRGIDRRKTPRDGKDRRA